MIEFNALASLAFGLGVKHGLDPDHLAAIDGLTRFNATTQPRLARFCGMLFSAGHGSVVVGIAVAAASLSQRWTPPAWLDFIGSWGAIAVLAALGFGNLYAVLRTPDGELTRMMGFKGRWLERLLRASNPVTVCLLGVLFALSFDTVSQGLMFAMTTDQAGGLQQAGLLGVCFTLGMMLTDGINGFWIARLIRQADRDAAIASRVMSVLIAIISLLTAVFGAAALTVPAVEVWVQDKQSLLGLAITGLIAAGYGVVAWRCSRARAACTAAATRS
jgi:nickel/cobalt transporter (NiCoT) family protein